jgi:hypothetical protein
MNKGYHQGKISFILSSLIRWSFSSIREYNFRYEIANTIPHPLPRVQRSAVSKRKDAGL